MMTVPIMRLKLTEQSFIAKMSMEKFESSIVISAQKCPSNWIVVWPNSMKEVYEIYQKYFSWGELSDQYKSRQSKTEHSVTFIIKLL